jgi:Holliday junction resolvase
MTHPSKNKGNRVERLVVSILESLGCDSQRAYASNGLSLGEHEECDVVSNINGKRWRFQVKARKKVAEWIKPNMNVVDAQIIKSDREEPLIVMPLKAFVQEIQNARQ